MPRLLHSVGCALLTSLLTLWAGQSPALAREASPALRKEPSPLAETQARVIVKYRASSALRRALAASSPSKLAMAPRHAQALSGRLNIPLSDGRVLGPHTQALRGRGISSVELAQRLSAQADIEWAVVDARRRIRSLPNDPYFGPNQTVVTPLVGQWYLRAPDNETPSAINAPGAWALSTGSSAVTVAVLDTGVRMDHPDLIGKLHPGYDFVSEIATANDGNLRDGDASDPGDATDPDECSPGEPAWPSSWHGTQVAGLIGAAANNGQGIAGVGRDVMLLPIRVLGRCGGYDSDIIAGMRWAAGLSSDVGVDVTQLVVNQHPARVLNMSLGSVGVCPASYREAMSELHLAGVTVVVSAGNDAGQAVDIPANCPGALAVGGLRQAGTKVGYSNLGPEIALSAPAGNCVNTRADEPCLYSLMTSTNLGLGAPAANGYSSSELPTYGTSFSAPLVAGTVGLMLSLNPGLTPDQIRSTLQASARPFTATGPDPEVTQCRAPDGAEQLECYCTRTTCGAGMLDASGALAKVQADMSAIAGKGGGAMSWLWLMALLLASWRARQLRPKPEGTRF